MTEQTRSGVYIEEIPVRAHAIEGVTTSTAGFVGEAIDGPVGESTKVTSFVDFERVFGGIDPDRELGYAVLQFFRNGGSRAVVIRVEGPRDAVDALPGFDRSDPPDILCLPGWTDPEVLAGALGYCHRRRAFLVADPPSGDPRTAVEQAQRLRSTGSANAGVYFPAVSITDPVHGDLRSSAPSGSVAGLMARTDTERGVWQAPAGVGARLIGVTGVQVEVAGPQAEALAADGVNVIRSIPSSGVVVWGSRTISTDDQWRYVPIRRLALFIEESLDRGLQWAVFEPNDEPLWLQVRLSVGTFLSGLWRAGALQGASADEAFVVECDRTTMTQNDLDNGRLVALVGVAPVRPAEFVIFRIGIWTHRATT